MTGDETANQVCSGNRGVFPCLNVLVMLTGREPGTARPRLEAARVAAGRCVLSDACWSPSTQNVPTPGVLIVTASAHLQRELSESQPLIGARLPAASGVDLLHTHCCNHRSCSFPACLRRPTPAAPSDASPHAPGHRPPSRLCVRPLRSAAPARHSHSRSL